MSGRLAGGEGEKMGWISEGCGLGVAFGEAIYPLRAHHLIERRSSR